MVQEEDKSEDRIVSFVDDRHKHIPVIRKKRALIEAEDEQGGKKRKGLSLLICILAFSNTPIVLSTSSLLLAGSFAHFLQLGGSEFLPAAC